MFEHARIKLTLWYLLIIMTISIFFSAFIYRGVSLEFHRRLDAIENRLELRRYGFRPPVGETMLLIQDLNEARRRILFILTYTNVVILIVSALAGYFLAGKTLQPIEATLEEQKRFVADASHELKTPLTALQTSIEVALRDKNLNLSQAKSTLCDSLDDVDNLKKLTVDLLSLTRYQQRNGNFRTEKVKITEVLENARKLIQPLAKKKGIILYTTAKDFSCIANGESLEKLLTILFDNAVKFTPKNGKVWVTVKQNNRSFNIMVKDTGIGIPKKVVPHLFDRFYRAEESRSKNRESGYGLGLSIAKEIVDLHNGSIKVESKIGKGSTFTITLPR